MGDESLPRQIVEDGCSSIEGIAEKILSQLSAYSDKYADRLDSLIANVINVKEELLTPQEPSAELSIPTLMIWEECVRKVQKGIADMAKDHREIHSSVSKCGREIDKHFVPDMSIVCPQGIHYEQDEEMRNKVDSLVAQHLLTQGLFDIAETLAAESDLELEEKNKSEFVQVNEILEQIKAHNLEPAIEWVTKYKEQLRDMGSSLEFHVHKMKFICLMCKKPPNFEEIINYATNFDGFDLHHSKELQRIMGTIAFCANGLDESNPYYSDLLDPFLWAQLADMFAKDSCTLLGLSVRSPLSIIINAGSKALPVLLGVRKVMMSQQRNVAQVLSSSKELPIDVDLGPDCRFHSVFSCPILRQQASETNPPMKLVCGHVICKDAMTRISGGGSRIKCPYCPMESSTSDAKKVYF